MAKNAEQAQKVLELLKEGPVTRSQLLTINTKYPSDPIYYARTLLGLHIRRSTRHKESVYILLEKTDYLDPRPVVEVKPETVPVAEITTGIKRGYLVPEWEGSAFQQWAKNYCSRNQWRVYKAIGDYQDCMAECALIWVECCRRYGAAVDNDAWMMRMFQICVITTFDTKSVKDSNDKKLHQALPVDEPSVESEAQLLAKLSSASSELKAVMKVFLNAPQEMLDVVRSEASSCHPMQFFRAVVGLCGFPKAKSAALARELQSLLGK